MADTRQFLSTILPWPGDGPGYVNLHWTTPDKANPKRSYFNGTPFKTVDQFLNRAMWLKDQTDVRDMYFCTSLQSGTTTTKQGKLKAIREQRNVLSLTAFFYDLDAKNYASKDAAADALGVFLQVSGLPPPTAIVDSGGGFHIYWAVNKWLTRQEWQPYANGMRDLALKHDLKIDGSVTIDSARVLRVPDTYNFKQSEKRPVRLVYFGETQNIALFDAIRSQQTLAVPQQQVLLHDPAGFSGGPAFSGPETPRLPVVAESPPLALEPILAGCEFLRTAVETGGKDYAQPAWNLTTLAATFISEGHALAHRMSAGHGGYDQEKTDDLFARKVREKEEKGLGWPSCKAISDAGSTACQGCPHFAKGKSPLHLAIQPAASLPAVVDTTTDALVLPSRASIADGRICWEDYDAKGNARQLPLFISRLSEPWAQRKPFAALNFTTSIDQKNIGRVCVKVEDMKAGLIESALLKAEVKYHYEHKKHLEGFFLGWLEQLHQAQEASKVEAFGWHAPAGIVEGFCYGGKLLMPNSGEKVAGYVDKETAEYYAPAGDIQPWLDCCKVITDQKRPEVEVGVIAAFASPLMRFAAIPSACLALWGVSGTGKSTSIELGIAMWSHPRLTKEVAHSTVKSVLEKAGNIKALPIYKDDIQKQVDMDYFIDQLFSNSQGVTGSRLNSDTTQKGRKTWNNILIVSSNRSFAERVMVKQPDHDAGLKRLFEIEMDLPVKGGPGRLPSTLDALRLWDKLNDNYGQMGMRYSRFLIENHAEADAITCQEIKWFESEMKNDDTERFWTTTCGVLMAGAILANRVGCEFDLEAIRAYLVKKFEEQRRRVLTEARMYGSPTQLLNRFFNEHVPNQGWTNGGQREHFTGEVRQGRPVPVGVVRPPERRDGLMIQWDQKSRDVRFNRTTFYGWLRDKGLSTNTVMKGLEKVYKVKYPKAKLGAGSGFSVGQDNLIQIEIGADPEHPLRDLLYQHHDRNTWPEDNNGNDSAVADSSPVKAGGSGEEVPPGSE